MLQKQKCNFLRWEKCMKATYAVFSMWDEGERTENVWGQRWSKWKPEQGGKGFLPLQEQVLTVQNPAEAGGRGIKQKQSCLASFCCSYCMTKMNVCTDCWSVSGSLCIRKTGSHLDQYAPHLSNHSASKHTHTLIFLRLWSVVNEYCAFWRNLFIYSADVGMRAAESPWLLHSHVTHQASLERLQLL